MPQVIPDVVKVEMRYNAGEQSGVVENVYYVGVTSEDIATLDAIEATFLAWETIGASDIRSNEVSLVEIVCTGMGSLSSPRKVYPVSPPVVGGYTSGVLPPNVTVAIHATSTTRGRGVSGRKFWIGLGEGEVVKATLLTATKTAILTAMNDLLTAIEITPGCVGLVTPHLVIGGLRPGIAGSTPIVGWTVTDTFIDSQKLRLPNHKKHKRPTP